MINFIIKRDGTKEPFEAIKINGWGLWASKELGDLVDWSSAVMHAVGSLPSESSSKDLQHSLIRYCLGQNTWSWNRMAGKLYAATHHKDLYPKDKIPSIYQIHQKLISIGYMVHLDYTAADYALLNNIIDHNRDFGYAHSQIHQIRYKYALRNAITNEEYETCQFVFMRMAMALGEDQPRERRMEDVIHWYNFFSQNKINAPTPNYTNLGTKLNGYASCNLIKSGDTADSLAISDHIAYKMTVMSAGIGINIDTRSIGDPVRGGLFPHRGKLWYYRALQGAVQANIKNGRNGACTVFFSAFDPENRTILRLKNPMTPADMQIRGMDYAMMSNKLLGRKAARKEDVFLFNSYTAPELTKAFYGPSLDKFIEIYNQYEANPNFKKTYVSARELLVQSRNEAYETGRAYFAAIDEINKHTTYKDPIHSSNLCVAPETFVLTDKGHLPIAPLLGQTVNIWNGEEYSEVEIKKTGENQPLLTVELSDGKKLDCTLYHKWYIEDGLNNSVREVRTHQLVVGDQLIKFDLPIIEGFKTLERAYLNGFFSGSGIQLSNGQQIVTLPAKRRDLSVKMGEELEWVEDFNGEKITATTSELRRKYFVPDSSYSTQSRLDWFAGLLDAEGGVYRKVGSEFLSMLSSNRDFLTELQLMLQTLGVNAKVIYSYSANNRLRVTNGDNDAVLTDIIWRLSVSNIETQRLYQMGLNTRRLEIERRGIEEANIQVVTVVSVTNKGRKDDTYCLTEPKRHMVIFNGILTGNCVEITEPTEAYEDMRDLYTDGPVGYIKFKDQDGNTYEWNASSKIRFTNGTWDAAQNLKINDAIYFDPEDTSGSNIIVSEIIELKKESEVALCSLAAIVLPNISSPQEYELAMYYSLLMIDKCIHKTKYVLPHVGYTAKSRLSAGVGIMSLAHHMARKGLKYSTIEGLEEMHRVAETHMYYAIKGSLRLGRELGNAPWIHRTKWTEGWIPLDTYNKNVDELVPNVKLQYDWEALRAEIIENKGIRNSSLVAYMPGESSSKASGGFNSIYPARDLWLMKTDGANTIYWTAPEGDTLKDAYEIAWTIPVIKQLHGYAVFQKWTDMAISADTFQRIQSSDKISSDEMLQQCFTIYKYGVKTQYYTNTQTTKAIVLDRPEVKIDVNTPVDITKRPIPIAEERTYQQSTVFYEVDGKVVGDSTFNSQTDAIGTDQLQNATNEINFTRIVENAKALEIEYEENNEGGAGCEGGACSL